MLCPKCGFISFDNLNACSKCQHDLSELKASLNGTAMQVENNYFLNSEDLYEDEPISEEIESASVETQVEDLAEQDLPAEQDTAELRLDLDDMPPIDLSEISPETEETEPDNMQVPLDTESLTLEINDYESELELVVEEINAEVDGDNNNGVDSVQIPINLEQIDLSDLVHSPEKASASTRKKGLALEQASETASSAELVLEDDSQPQNSTIDLDSLDLNLEENETSESDDLELLLDTNSNNLAQDDLEPIDLTLELDSNTEKINMSLDDILEETDVTD